MEHWIINPLNHSNSVLSSRRFWVLEGDYELQGESDEEAELHLKTGSEEAELKEQVSPEVVYLMKNFINLIWTTYERFNAWKTLVVMYAT